MTLLSIVCMRIWFVCMYDRYDINIRIVTEIWSMKYVHQGESWSWWWERRCSSRKLEDVLVSDGGTLGGSEGIIVICINNGAKPHNLATRQIKTSRGVFNHRRSQYQSPAAPLSPPKPGSVSDMHTVTWAQSRSLDSGLILRWSSKKQAKVIEIESFCSNDLWPIGLKT